MLQLCEEELEANGGDYFGLLEWLFQRLIDELQETKTMMEVVRNVFTSQEGESLFGMDGDVPDPAFGEGRRYEDEPVIF